MGIARGKRFHAGSDICSLLEELKIMYIFVMFHQPHPPGRPINELRFRYIYFEKGLDSQDVHIALYRPRVGQSYESAVHPKYPRREAP